MSILLSIKKFGTKYNEATSARLSSYSDSEIIIFLWTGFKKVIDHIGLRKPKNVLNMVMFNNKNIKGTASVCHLATKWISYKCSSQKTYLFIYVSIQYNLENYCNRSWVLIFSSILVVGGICTSRVKTFFVSPALLKTAQT